MASQNRVSLVFDADTSKAKASINELYSTLERLSSININNAPGKLLTKDIQEASLAATQLKISLENAVNVNTGKLDLNKFNSSLQQSKMSLQDYQRILTSCGPAGQQAFTQLARSVITADASVIKLGDKVKALGVTLANTAKWQISSSIIHGITGAFSTAYNYAKDLNESLNNIRIVTGYSVDSMRDFAAEANKAAKALSTTTTEYSNAALIFYQQGLSSSQVKERVDTVIKLANVTGESASQVSDYMTAIWNNFYDGSQSLEHYADVLTKLGAATASSSDEIAGGLEKFSAIAETIGLSYEYAASALATITAQTRQSEDVVGTALKTIFARIQGLSLGETLEDNVDLNKYSAALKKVGIDVLDVSGELKDMDTILNELGARWDTLTKAQQTALAQTVAGVRQYNQLISLMDNWDDFEINLDLALNSDGSLEDQYAIYEQSWEAASKRMRAASEDMYDSLINDEAFIKLTDFFTHFIQSISASIDSIGGLKGVLLLLSSVMMKVFSPQIGNFLDSLGLKIQNIATGTNKGLYNMKQQATAMLGDTYSSSGSFSGGVQAVAAENMGSVNQAYLAHAEKLGTFQKSIAESLLQQQNALNESVIKQGELVKGTEKEYEKRKATLSLTKDSLQGGTKTTEGRVAYNKVTNKGADAVVKIAESAGIEGVEKTQTKGKKKGKVLSTDINITDEATALKLQTAALEEYTTKISQAQAIKEAFISPMAGLENETANLEALAVSLERYGSAAELSKQDIEELNSIIASSDFATIESELDKGIQSFDALEAALKKQGKTMEQTFGKAGANAIKQYAAQIKSAKSAQDTMRKSSEKIKELDEKIARARTNAAKQKYEKERAAEQEKLTAATQQYNNAVQGSKTAMANAGAAGKSLRAVFGEVDAAMKQMNMDAATAKNALLALGYSESQLQALEQACEDMNVDFAQLITLLAAAKGGAQNFEGQLNRLATSSQTVGQTLSRIGSVASQVAMGINAISGLGEIWSDEDLTIGEKFTSTLMNLAMILPLVGTAIDAVNKLKNINKINSLAAAGATEVEIATQMKQMGVTAAETTGLWGKAAAWIAAHPLLSGIGIAAAAAGISLMAIMTAHEKKQTQELEAQAKAAEKEADASRKKAEASKEELNAIKDLHEEYDELYSEYKDSGEIKSDLITTTTDLVNKLGIEEGHLLILQGRYEELNALIKERLKLKAQDNKDNANWALGDAVDSAYNTLKAGENDKVFINNEASEKGHENQYVMGFWDVGANDAWFTDYLTSKYPNGPWEIVGDKVVAYYTNSNQIPYLQNQFDTVFQGALDSVGGASKLTDAQRNGSIYNEYQRGIVNGGNEDSSKAWKGVLDAGEEAYAADFEYELFEDGVDDAASYGETREAWIEKMVAQTEGDKEAAREYYSNLIDNLVQDTSFADYANEYSAYETQGTNLGANSGKYKTVDDIADQMETDGYDRDLALQVRIEPWMNEDDITNAIALAQDIADKNQIELTITAAEEGIEALEDVVSAKDYEAWWEKYGEQALKGTDYDKNTFAALSPSEQKEILEGQAKLKPTQSTTDAELEAAKGRGAALATEHENFINNNSKYFDDQGNFKYYDYQAPTTQWTSDAFQNASINADQLQWVEDILTAQGIEFTPENLKQFFTDYYNTATTTGDRGEPQIAQNNFAEKYGINFNENKNQISGIYSDFLGDGYNALGQYGVTGEMRSGMIDRAMEGYTEAGMWENYEAWKDRPGEISEVRQVEEDYLDLVARQNANASEIQTLEEQSAQEKQVDPYKAEMDFKEEVTKEEFDVDEVYNYVDALIESGKFLEENREEAQEFALTQMKMERGFKNLVDNYEDWNDVLGDNNASLKDISRVMPKVNDMLQDMMGLSNEDFALLPDDFAQDNWDLIQDVYNQVDGAYEALRAKVTEEMVMNMKLNPNSQTEVMTAVNNFLANVDLDDIEVGTTLDQTGFAEGLQALLDSGAVTVEQMNSILEGIGYEPNIEYETVEIEAQDVSAQTGNVQVTDVNGNVRNVPVESIMEVDGKQYVKVPKIGKIGSSKFKGGGGSVANAKKGGGGGGGGGSKPKKADTVKKSDVVDRYKETDDKLDDIRDKMDDASKAADRLWGPARLKQMKKINEALEDEIDALKTKRKEAENYLKQDKKDLINIGKENGVSFTFDAKGNISNYTAEMTKLYNELDAAITSANADGNATESEQEKIDKIQERIDKVKEAIDQYDETRELIEDLDNDIQDKIYEWQDNNYEQLNYKLELEIEINDSEMERLEYYLGKIEGNIYKTAEAFTKMKEITDVYNDNLSNQAQYVADLENAYYAGEISLDAYKEGLRESQSATIENLQALQEQKEAMQDYYGEVMNLALEEIALYTDEMEELNSVLDHYSNVLELVGKQEDYATKGKVLQSKATNLRNEMQVQQKLYEESNAEAEKWAEKMANAVEGSNEYETYKKNWIAAQEAANEAQDNMLSKTEEWAEAMKAVVENELADLAHTMEESLTGGTSFDELLTSMERRSSLQEEYLTTTNQIYETNKLMRQAQQEIDKTTNSVAKRRLQGFINETAHMQDQNKLSQYELDIQQAKYDLLLAEIALEEAQNAKSTVRLQRDSEGNFGYVYTADSSAVAEAEQELADKQNALYNLGIEGANDYSQKYAETMQEAQDAITELTEMWMNGEIESEEEFQRRKAEIQDYYYEKLKQYSNLYQVALTTDSNVIKDAWSSDFNDMIYKTEEWKGAVDEYFVGAAESMQVWAEVCATVLSESGLDDISTKVGEIDQKSQDLKTTLIGEDGESGVVGAMMSEVEAAGKLSEAYVGIQNEIDKLIEKYEELLEKVNEDYTNPDTEVVDPAIDPDEEEEEDPTPPIPDSDPPAGPTWDRVKAAYDRINAGKWGNGINNRIQNGKNEGFTEEEVRLGQKLINKVQGGMSLSAAKKALGFDTGGYTGDWAGSYGKLAFLHQKELVLNQGDTENFLASMEVLERILQMIDLQSASSQIGGLLNSPSIGPASSEPLEQNVHIEASFPNVSDRNEIEEAFSNLINLASQYAYRD